MSSVVDAADVARARRAIASWPGYAPTPLVALRGLAARLGVESLRYKDESARFGLASFKALGGPYALGVLLLEAVARARPGTDPDFADLFAGRYAALIESTTACCATDGNHGAAVAWAARLFGCAAVVFVPPSVSRARRGAIAAFGARVIRTAGNYDECVRQAKTAASEAGWIVVSDTSWEGYTEIPRRVMHGYGVMAAEIAEQFAGERPPTHVFLQAGVGGMAAAVCAHVRRSWTRERPKIVLVEPERAACWYESIRAGRPATVDGDLATVMGGLSCGEVSRLAWDVLATGADAAMTISDREAIDCMKLLANGAERGDAAIVAGESGAAGLAGLIAAARSADARDRLGLGSDSRVLVVGTEGATDPDLYAALVGRTADSVHGSVSHE